MWVEFTARCDQPVDDQQLQYFFPTNRFASFREPFLPEPVQSHSRHSSHANQQFPNTRGRLNSNSPSRT